MYSLDATKVFENYEPLKEEIGIRNVGDFINILDSFDENLVITQTENYLNLVSGDRRIKFMLSGTEEIKKGKRKLNTSKFKDNVKLPINEQVHRTLVKDISLFARVTWCVS